MTLVQRLGSLSIAAIYCVGCGSALEPALPAPVRPAAEPDTAPAAAAPPAATLDRPGAMVALPDVDPESLSPSMREAWNLVAKSVEMTLAPIPTEYAAFQVWNRDVFVAWHTSRIGAIWTARDALEAAIAGDTRNALIAAALLGLAFDDHDRVVRTIHRPSPPQARTRGAARCMEAVFDVGMSAMRTQRDAAEGYDRCVELAGDLPSRADWQTFCARRRADVPPAEPPLEEQLDHVHNVLCTEDAMLR